MNKLSRILFGVGFGMAVSSLLFGWDPAWAAEAEPAIRKIAVVNVGRLLKEYQKTHASEEQLEKLAGEKKTEKEKLVTEIQNMRDELVLMNEEKKAQRRQEIDEKLKHLAQFNQETQQMLLKQREQELDGLLSELQKAVQGYAKEKGYDLVLNDQAVLYSVEAADLTDEVLAILNGGQGGKQ